MRLVRFYIRRHLLLHDLDLHFDRPGRLNTGQYALDFLVGVNGTGKSTVLRSLAQVFANLRADQFNPFDFALEYTVGGHESPQFVSIQRKTNEGFASLQMTVRAGEETIYDSDSIDARFLPRRVIVYSTGNEFEWKRIMTGAPEQPGTEDASRDVLDDDVRRATIELPGRFATTEPHMTKRGEPPFWLLRAERLPAMTLCGLLAHLESGHRPLPEVIEGIGIESITGFSLRFRLHTALSSRTEYEKLAKYATRRLRQGTDYLVYFDLLSQPGLATDLLKEFNGSFELYRTLDQLLDENADTGQPTLQQISILLQRAAPPGPEEDKQVESDVVPSLFLLDWLSDGERSFLGRMALLAMIDTDDSLILLDEPEVHFNDYWKRKLIHLIDSIMRSHSNQLLMTTHSTIVMSDATADQVFLFAKDESGIVRVVEPVPPLFGSDPGNIMVNLLGSRRAGGSYSQAYLEAAIKRGERQELQELLEKVGPGYWQFRILDRLEAPDAPPN